MATFTRRAVDCVRSSAVALLGLGVLAIVAAYVVTFGGPYPRLVLGLILPTAVGLGFVRYGLWIRNRAVGDGTGAGAGADPDRATVVTLCSCACGVLLTLVCLGSLALLSPRIGGSSDLAKPVLNSLSTGLGLGAIIGHAFVELSRHRRENDRLLRAVDASMDGIAVVVDGDHHHVNDAYASLYGLRDGDALEGRPWTERYTKDSRQRIDREVRPAVAERNFWRGRLTGTRPDGTTFPQDVTVSGLENGSVIVARDVTEQRDREQRIQVLNRVLRHNLRNAFTVIRGHANLIGERDPELERRHVRPIQAEIDDLLATADKARSAERTLDRHGQAGTVAVTEAVQTVAERARAAHPDARIVSRIETPDGTTPTINDAVVDALNELVDNAVQHNATDAPTVEITARAVETDGRSRIEFTVADDGPGIPPTERRAVLEGRETALDHGSGLGLWLVNWIVRTTGGNLSFADAPGDGTTVRLSFPDATGAGSGTRSEAVTDAPSNATQ